MSESLTDSKPGYESDIDSRVAKILASGMSYEELTKHAAEGWSWSVVMEDAYQAQEQLLSIYESQLSLSQSLLKEQMSVTEQLVTIGELQEQIVAVRRFIEGQIAGRGAQRKIVAKKGGEALHSKRDGSREKRRLIQEAWASGKYSSRDICADEECGALKMSFSTARKALRNTPEPPSRC